MQKEKTDNFLDFNIFLNLYKDILEISISAIKDSNKDYIKTIDKTIFIDSSYVQTQVNLYKHSKPIKLLSEALSKLITCTTTLKPSLLAENLRKKGMHLYSIPLLSKTTFISEDDFSNIINSAQKIVELNCSTSKELLDKINNLFIIGGYTQLNTSTLKKIFKENNLQLIPPTYIANFSSSNLISQKDVDIILSKVELLFKTKILCISNLTYDDYINLSKAEFFDNYVAYSEIEDSLKEFIAFPKHSSDYGFTYKFNIFAKTNIRVIGLRSPVNNIFINKKDFDEVIETLKTYTSIYDIQKTLKLNTIDRRSFEAQNIDLFYNLPLTKEGIYVKTEDAKKFIDSYNYKKDLAAANTVFERYMLRINYSPNPKESLIPQTLKFFNDFVLLKSNKIKSIGGRDTAYYDLYNILCDTLKTDLTSITGELLQKELNKILLLASAKYRTKEAWVGFLDFLKLNCTHFKPTETIKLVSTSNKLQAYSRESFINLAMVLIDIIEDKNLIKKTYRNWNNSSALCYVFLHLCLAWRRNDLTTKLPSPNLNLISNLKDYNDFIEWLESGNELSERVSLLICHDIETKVKRFNFTASKNNENLACVIPKFLSRHLALILCINEANKQLAHKKYNKTNRLDISFTKRGIENVNSIFVKEFNTDLVAILGEPFNNIKATKSFLTLITEKSEEFGLAYGYYFAQKLRAHKSSPEVLSNTTKIYLDKDISKASVMAFAVGTMGSIKYNLLSLVDDEFNTTSLFNQANSIVALNLTPSQIESATKTLAIKSEDIKNNLLKILTTKERKDNFIRELLYGKNSYGKHNDTKCLFKIIKNMDNKVTEISVNENTQCPFRTESCIGCANLISTRYFMYFIEDKFNKVLDSLENSTSQIDKDIHIGRLQELYLPTILDMFDIFGKETIANLLNTKRYKELIQSLNTEENC
ncbi:Uncharacterised protein [uncultured Clostridium sp.]|uniref:hypothetical protein n=1 Tax=uncultured Clostridium sp. TaxID=59620 RepID=UPI0008221776|nr:hypothetical protein [uncultured Clostridium sp.]SCJ87525.1 Uncharacterised protein [uncultured Clostridium sp.]